MAGAVWVAVVLVGSGKGGVGKSSVAADSGRPLVLEPGDGEAKGALVELAEKLAIAVGIAVTEAPAEVVARNQPGAAMGAQIGA